MPRVTVIIPTYNWSSVLRYSIRSVLWQKMQDFELVVVGDGCTDDSAEVVASFHDPRISWHNLKDNTGSQSAPNNKGLELAKAPHIAYLGHDDIWHPEHLEILLNQIQDRDVAYSLAAMIGPKPENIRGLTGLSPSGTYEYNQFVPPSSVLHKREVAEDIGGWKHYRTINMQPDVDFLTRALEFGKRFVTVYELTVFKFPSNMRKNSYKDKPFHEQAECMKRIENEPDFRYRQLIEIYQSQVAQHPELTFYGQKPQPGAAMGSVVDQWRTLRGLDTK
jgi:glycosyltransferase involved in cell wall biosynthesis